MFRILIFILLISTPVWGQSFGFGCLGLVGGYGGYSYQTFKATGFNEYINEFNLGNDTIQSPLEPFRRAAGTRFGINLFRADFEGFIFTAKGYYQSLSEKHSIDFLASTGGTGIMIYELKFKSWGVGFDLGTAITRSFSWKVVDAALLFNKGQLIETLSFPGKPTNVNTYENLESSIGYSVGTGFILNIIDRYVTLEGTGGYTFLPFRTLKTKEGGFFPRNSTVNEIDDFIEKFGFNAVIQLNIGFPF